MNILVSVEDSNLKTFLFSTCYLKILTNILQSLLSTSRILSVSTSVESNETHTQIFNLFQGTYVLEGANVRGGANVLSRANVLGKTQFFWKESIVFAPLAQLYICNVFKSLSSPTGIGQFLKALRLAQVQDTGLVNFDIWIHFKHMNMNF